MYSQSRQFSKQLEDLWDRMYRVCYSWCHDPQLSADLVQESIESALRHHRKIPDASSLQRWLFRVLVNKWRDHCRTHKSHADVESIILIDNNTPESEHEYSQTIQRVNLAMSRLSTEQREVLSLVSLEGMSYEDVANVLAVPIGTIMSRLCRSRKLLRKYLREPQPAPLKNKPNIRRIK